MPKHCSVDGCSKKHNCKGMCKKHYMLWWRAKHPDKQKAIARKAKLKNQFGITLGEYRAMFNTQNGTCAICKKRQKQLLSIDHCHETGKIRGLLCLNCNTGLGQFKDDKALLVKAIAYLG